MRRKSWKRLCQERQQYIVPFSSTKSMNRILVLFTLCLTALSIQCDEDKIYIKVIKESVNDCEEESFQIKNQGQVWFAVRHSRNGNEKSLSTVFLGTRTRSTV